MTYTTNQKLQDRFSSKEILQIAGSYQSGCRLSPTTYANDGLHPNVAGNLLYANDVYAELTRP